MDSESLYDRYYGDLARSYDGERANTGNWIRENEIVARLLARVPNGASVLDVPVGTGRFAPLYQRFGLHATGVDASKAMLAEASAKGAEYALDWALRQGDIRALAFAANHFDAAVCMRFLNWLGPRDLDRSLTELARVTRTTLLFGVKVYAPTRVLAAQGRIGIARLARQCKRRFYMARTDGGFVFHEHRAVEGIRERLGLDIVERVCVTQRPDGVDYFIYLVEKNSS